jgi:hypothetical protein
MMQKTYLHFNLVVNGMMRIELQMKNILSFWLNLLQDKQNTR